MQGNVANKLNCDFHCLTFVYLEYERLYRTGDYASIEKGGIIHYEGRTDSQVKIRGHRVDLTEIERNLSDIDGIEKGIVLCYHAGQMDQAILAFALLSATSSMHSLQIENMLRNKLPDYMVPQVICIDQVPLLVNGKIDRQTLLKMYENTNNNGKQLNVTNLIDAIERNANFSSLITTIFDISFG